MTLYAPGGESEKTRTLNKLQNPTRCADAQSAAEELRAWERWKNRAQTLHGVVDARSYHFGTGCCRDHCRMFDKGQNSEMAFWGSLVRSLLQVHSKPTMDTVKQFQNHLLGEMEQLASLSAVRKGVVASSKAGGTGLTPNPKAKSPQAQGQAPNEKPPKAKTPCMFFGNRDTGCSRGRKCPQLHSWDGVPDKPSRCRECSSTKHFAKDCPTQANDAGKRKGKGQTRESSWQFDTGSQALFGLSG